MDERTMRNLNLGFRFILEMIVLVGLFLWGFSLSDQFIVQLVLGLGAALAAMLVWGLFVAPKAKRRLPDPARLAVELVVFGAGVLAFVLSGNFFLGILLGTAALISLALMFYWDQRAY
jgi:small-conductance mechanosensitive channel